MMQKNTAGHDDMKKFFIIFLSISFSFKVFGSVRGLIGPDDRVYSSDPRMGRFVYQDKDTEYHGGTGWLTSFGCVFTAGHIPKKFKVIQIEFNVPLSLSDGTTVPSLPEDTYKVELIKYEYIEALSDWAIYKVFPNQITGISAFKRQKYSYRVLDDCRRFLAPNINPVVRVTGFGQDRTPPGETNPLNCYHRTLQTDTGELRLDQEIVNDPYHLFRYYVDTENSNSGSPVFLEGTQLAIAIHIRSDSDSSPPHNLGVGFKNKTLCEAIDQYLGATFLVDGNYGLHILEGNGSKFSPYRKLQDGLTRVKKDGGLLSIISGHYPVLGTPTGKSTLKFQAPIGKKVSVKALAGSVSIGKVIKKSNSKI